MACNIGAISVAVYFKTIFGMLSRSDDLSTFKSFRSFSTPPVVISRLGMSDELVSVHCGMVDLPIV